jgi:hypothetical protein
MDWKSSMIFPKDFTLFGKKNHPTKSHKRDEELLVSLKCHF